MKRTANIILTVCAIPVILSACALLGPGSEEEAKER